MISKLAGLLVFLLSVAMNFHLPTLPCRNLLAVICVFNTFTSEWLELSFPCTFLYSFQPFVKV